MTLSFCHDARLILDADFLDTDLLEDYFTGYFPVSIYQTLEQPTFKDFEVLDPALVLDSALEAFGNLNLICLSAFPFNGVNLLQQY